MDAFAKSTNVGFGLVGTDFVVTADLTDDLTYQGELNLQVERGGSGEIEVDAERFYIDYAIKDWINVQAGLYFTPIGFINRNLYARAWLMKSVSIRDFVEEELGLVPSHTIGVNVHGTLPVQGEHALSYIVSMGNGRTIDPTQNIYARDETNKSKEITALLEWSFPGFNDFRIGVSGYTDEIHSYRVDELGGTVNMDDEGTQTIKLREIGFNPYLVLDAKHFDVVAEFVYSQQKDLTGNLGGRSYTFQSFTAEVAANLFNNKFHPYLRYDVTSLPDDGGPFFGLREDGGDITRYYVPEYNAIMVGVAYDLKILNRIKLEYVHHMDGPRQGHAIAFQTAFGF